MNKLKWISFALLCTATIIFVACSSAPEKIRPTASTVTESPSVNKAYGAYLAGRVAHIRKDFDKASDYYINSLSQDSDNKELINNLYLLLVSQIRIDEAAIYAEKNILNGNKDNFSYTVIATKHLHDKQYQKSIAEISKFNNPAYSSFIGPLLNAWNYVGLNQPDKALKSLDILKKEAGFNGIYYFHTGLINDYFNRTQEAQTAYEALINEEAVELSLRSLEVISNFYLRTAQPEKAQSILSGISTEKNSSDILAELSSQIRSHASAPERIISSPQEGAAEALFSIAATFRYDDIIDIAHMFTALAIYQNPNYDLAKLLLADILENRNMYNEANDVYDSIKENSPAYYSAQLKMAHNLIKQQDYDRAEILLKSLALDYNKPQVYIDLGDVLRFKDDYKEAIKYYQTAINQNPDSENLWVLYYAMGISFEQNNNWQEAEKALLKALELYPDHPLVLNYLGYTWLKQKQNINQAFSMIINAYVQSPNNVNITDSLGWALYNLGYYGMAEKYLEKALQDAPANPVICDHLGDVYWFTGRRNEARFKWQQALDLKDESGEINRKDIKNKLKNGITAHPELNYDKDKITEQLKLITQKITAKE
ncbi:MAG: tetratricopeptide repeat protein [Alphaproteobacteria bacterium]|nr:tetratricopeptide repeat protein [Alphaproteobacteria bacterium]